MRDLLCVLENREYSRKPSDRINVICCDNCGIKCLEDSFDDCQLLVPKLIQNTR